MHCLAAAAFAVASMTLLAGVFAVPYVIPSSSAVVSASTLAGFNNTAAYLLYVGLLPPAGLALARLFKQAPIETVLVNKVSLIPTPLVWTVLGGHALLFLALFLVKGAFVFGDGLYFQHILARMASGAVLYRDVNFLYGPVMIYPAFWLSRVVGVTLAYGVYYIVMYLAGLYLLWLCMQAVVRQGHDTDRIFVLFSVGLFNLLLGMNYVLLRHVLPVAALLLAWRYVERPGVGRMAPPIAACFLALTYSLELGVLAVASILGLGILRLLPIRQLGAVCDGNCIKEFFGLVGICAAALGGFVGTFYVIDPSWQALLASLKPLLSYAAGGGNTPIYPSLPFVALMALTVQAVALTVRSLLSQGWKPGMELVLALLALSVVMQRPAFGKPDVPHIAYSGLPMFLLALLVIPPQVGWAKARILGLGVLLVGVMLPLQIFNVFMLKPYVEKKFAGWGLTEAIVSTQPASKVPIQDSVRRAVVYFGGIQTYYFHVLDYYSLPVLLERDLKMVPYLSNIAEAFSLSDIRKIIAELQQTRAIVVSRKTDLQRSAPLAYGGWEGILYQLTASPLPGSRCYAEVVAANETLRAPLREFLVSSYDVAFEDGELVGLTLRATVRSAQGLE